MNKTLPQCQAVWLAITIELLPDWCLPSISRDLYYIPSRNICLALKIGKIILITTEPTSLFLPLIGSGLGSVSNGTVFMNIIWKLNEVCCREEALKDMNSANTCKTWDGWNLGNTYFICKFFNSRSITNLCVFSTYFNVKKTEEGAKNKKGIIN